MCTVEYEMSAWLLSIKTDEGNDDEIGRASCRERV